MQTTYTATFSSKGQLTFPSALRKLHGIKPGQRVTITSHPTKKLSFNISNKPQIDLLSVAGSLKTNISYVPIETAREVAYKAIGEHRHKQMLRFEKELNKKKW